MMILRTDIDTQTDAGTIDKLQECLRLRQNVLRETTAQSVIATAVKILQSLRSNTVVAKVDKGNIAVKYVGGLVAGWRREGGCFKRCIRYAGGKRFTSHERQIFDCGQFARGESKHVYYVTDSVADGVKFSYYLVSDDEKTANAYAVNRHKRHVKKFRGLAKFVLSYATRLVAQKGNVQNADTQIANKVGEENLTVNVDSAGWDSGTVTVEVHDNLRYATKALKDGPDYLETAIQLACNSTIGMINKKMDCPVSQRIDTPFPDARRK